MRGHTKQRKGRVHAARIAPSVILMLWVALSSCGPRAESISRHAGTNTLGIDVDPPSDAKKPAEVHVTLRGGSLRIEPRDGPLVAGTIRSPDPDLLPHVTTNARGVALVQDFDSPKGVLPAWDLTLGARPMRLFLHVLASEEQVVDLGGRAIASARIVNEGGHLRLRWSTPSSMPVEELEIASIGYVEVSHLAYSRAKRVSVKNIAGLAELDVGPVVESEIRLDAEMGSGKLAITVPANVPAKARVKAAVGAPTLEGWAGEGESFHAGPTDVPPRVLIDARAGAGPVVLRVR